MPRRLRTVVLAVSAALVLAACRLDVGVVVRLGADGTGEITVTATADADVIAQAPPGLAGDLRFDDAAAAGWVVDGPTPTEDGGLTMTLRHPVASAEEATSLLASLGPPFVGVTLDRTVDGDGGDDDGEEVTVTLTGRLQLVGGWEAFADADLVAAAGVPFADELAASGATPAGSMAVRLRAELPGEVRETTGRTEDGGLAWDAPLDGSSTELATTTVLRPAEGSTWAGPLSWLLLVLLVAWVAFVAAVAAAVVRARRRRARGPALR